jgi:hypothetical protein
MWRQFYRDSSQTHVVDNISIAKLWKHFSFLFFLFEIEPLAVTFQTVNGQAIASDQTHKLITDRQPIYCVPLSRALAERLLRS